MLAEKFFGADHARKMCRLTRRQVRHRLACYLPRAIEYALSRLSQPAEQTGFIRGLVSGVYVIFDSKQCGDPEGYDEYFEGLSVSGYPAAVLYDDWYERSVGSSFFMCGTSLLMKSTGEKFGARELNWLKRSIQDNIDTNGPDELYSFECEPLPANRNANGPDVELYGFGFGPSAANRIWVKIYELDREMYLDGVMGQVKELGGRQLRLLVDGMMERLARTGEVAPRRKRRKNCVSFDEEETVPAGVKAGMMRRLVGDLQKLSKEEILGKIEATLSRRECSDETIREVERIANRLLGVELRDYHGSVIC
jgi:hypothetical protein